MQCNSVKFQLGQIEFQNENSEGISATWRGTETDWNLELFFSRGINATLLSACTEFELLVLLIEVIRYTAYIGNMMKESMTI